MATITGLFSKQAFQNAISTNDESEPIYHNAREAYEVLRRRSSIVLRDNSETVRVIFHGRGIPCASYFQRKPVTAEF